MSDFNQTFNREGATVSGKDVSLESNNCRKTGVVIPLPQRYHHENTLVSIEHTSRLDSDALQAR